MSPAEASRLLDLPTTATPAEVQARFKELRGALEEKIAQAPTPGLEARYRTALAEITTAFETLTLAAESADLPVLGKISAPPAPPAPATSAAVPAAGPRPTRRLHVLLAVTLLGAFSFGAFHLREQRAEAARVAAAQQAEIERQQQLAREKAEQERLAAERQHQAELAAQARRQKISAELRPRLTALRNGWETLERELRTTERTLGEYRASLTAAPADTPKNRELTQHVTAQSAFVTWLDRYLTNQPVRHARARAEDSLAAGDVDAAGTAIAEGETALAAAGPEIKRERDRLFAWNGTLDLRSTPEGLKWQVTDNFGRVQSGTTPAKVAAAPGNARIVFSRPNYNDVTYGSLVGTGRTNVLQAVVETQEVKIQAEDDVQILVEGRFLGVGTANLWDEPPGTYNVELRRANFPPYRTRITVQQVREPAVFTYSFTALAKEDRSCTACSGKGRHERSERCSTCNGGGGYTCTNCRGRGVFHTPDGTMRMNCRICGGDGRETCRQCTRGRVHYSSTCQRCGGDGRVSQLQLAQSAQ